MRKLIIILSLFYSLTLFANGIEGSYSNGTKGCHLITSITDYHGVGRESLVLLTDKNKITKWGANFNIELNLLSTSEVCPKKIVIDNSMGLSFGGEKTIIAFINQNTCEITDYKLVLGELNNPRDTFECLNLKKGSF